MSFRLTRRIQHKPVAKRLFQGLGGSVLARINPEPARLDTPAPGDGMAAIAIEILTESDRNKKKRGRPPKNKVAMTDAERKFLSRKKAVINELEIKQQRDQDNDRQAMFMPDAPRGSGKLVNGGNANDMEVLDLSARRIDRQYDPENSIPSKSTAVPNSADTNTQKTKENDSTFMDRQNFSKNRKWTTEEKEKVVIDELIETGISFGVIVGRESEGKQYFCQICHYQMGSFYRDAVKHISRHRALIDARIKELFPPKPRRNKQPDLNFVTSENPENVGKSEGITTVESAA